MRSNEETVKTKIHKSMFYKTEGEGSFCKTSVSFKIARFQFCVIKSQKKIIHFFKVKS